MIQRMLPARAISRIQLTRAYSTKPANPTTQFYKTFTRPVAKVMLTAVFTYQVVYWSWLKLEADEQQADTDAVIAGLEKTVNEYESKKSKEVKK